MTEEEVEFPAGRIEGALLLFRAVVDQWAAVGMNRLAKLLGHSTVLVTMRYLHPNLDRKTQAIAKLAADCDNSVTVGPKVQQLIPKASQIGR